MSGLRLYSYFRSSAAYRVRIALNLKHMAYDIAPVHLLRGGGEHLGAEYRSVNPQARVPALAVGERVLTQSPAILEWLEETHPEPPLLPRDPFARAKVRAAMSVITCDIHPLGNLGVLNWLRGEFQATPEQVSEWLAHWIGEGLSAVETMLDDGPFCFGATPTLADVCLVPQLFNARRFNVPLDRFPKIRAAAAACEALPEFAAAAPAMQPDAE